MNPEIVAIYFTAPSKDEARSIAQIVVRERLAACVNILGNGESVYEWQGSIQTAPECVALAKTTRTAANSLIKRIGELHSYECPAITSWIISYSTEDYARWVHGQVSST